MDKKRTTRRIIFFLISVVVFLWAASMMEARIGGGQKYSGKGIKSTKSTSRSTGSYNSSSSRTSTDTNTSYSSSSRSSGSSTRYNLSPSDRNAILMIVGGFCLILFLIIYAATFFKGLKKKKTKIIDAPIAAIPLRSV